MRICIPKIGEVLELSVAWSFPVYNEYRNKSLMVHLGLGSETGYDRGMKIVGTAVFAEGTVLTVDRVYIRKGAEEYNSVSFWLRTKEKTKEKLTTFKVGRGGVRFWAKLEDVNTMEIK